MQRIKLKDRILPTYTKGEEIFNMTSHIVGAVLGVVATVLCIVFASVRGNIYGIISGAIYGVTMIALYTMSSIYHGLSPKLKSKKVSNFELDRELYEGLKEFNKYKEEHPELKKSEVFNKIDMELAESEIEITAYRKYYNDIITDYNNLVKKIPSNLIALYFKFKPKNYFDGKDMNDEDEQDFKL